MKQLKSTSRHSITKKYIKFLSVIKDPQLLKHILATAPVLVLKTICNATLNALVGKVDFTTTEKRKLKKYKSILCQLLNKKQSIASKRKYLIQSGGFFAIPLILKAVLGTLGAALFQ